MQHKSCLFYNDILALRHNFVLALEYKNKRVGMLIIFENTCPFHLNKWQKIPPRLHFFYPRKYPSIAVYSSLHVYLAYISMHIIKTEALILKSIKFQKKYNNIIVLCHKRTKKPDPMKNRTNHQIFNQILFLATFCINPTNNHDQREFM